MVDAFLSQRARYNNYINTLIPLDNRLNCPYTPTQSTPNNHPPATTTMHIPLLTPTLTLLLTLTLTTRQTLPTTENGLVSTTTCKAVTLVYARGTNEAGNAGSIAGPPWFSRLRASLGTAAISVQGVDYLANVAGYQAGGSATGTTEMVRLVNLASSRCPSSKIVLGGYS